MVIGIDASRANKTQRTGTEWYSYHVICGLKKLIPPEHQVILYSKEPLQGDLADLPPHWRSRVLAWPPKLLWTQLRLTWEMIWHTPDFLYISAHTTPLVAPKKTVCVVHDVGFMRQEALYDDAAFGRKKSFTRVVLQCAVRIATLGRYGATEGDYHRFALDQAVKKSIALITVSSFSQAEIHTVTGVPKDRIHVIPNGLNSRTTESDPSIISTLNIRKPYLFFVGRLEEKKNILPLIDAFAILRKEYGFLGQLVLAGSPGFGYDRIVQRMVDQGVRDAVIETGWVSEGALSTLMQNAAVFVFPSLYEGFGIPVLEAMSVGIPVVCSNIPALREVASDAAVFFDPHSSRDMAVVIAQVLPQVARDAYAKKGVERSLQFSWKKTAQQTWEVLQSLI